MVCKYDEKFVLGLIERQVSSFYPFYELEKIVISNCYLSVINKLEKNFSQNKNKYYSIDVKNEKQTYFNALHTCQWFIFLYTLANHLFHEKNVISDYYQKKVDIRGLCDKLYAISKIISGADLYYEVEMPEVWTCDHPVGAVIGRGSYLNNFSFVQGCTIGNNKDIYPVLGQNVKMLSNSKILGNSHIGNNVIIAANTYICDANIPDNSIVFGQSPNLIIKRR